MTNPTFWNRLALTAIDLGRRTEIGDVLPALEQSQWLPADALAQMQIVRFQQILGFASQHVPFYKKLFAEHKWHPSDFVTLSDLGRLPIITKEVLRSAPLEFRPDTCELPIGHKSRHTGGSTGEPLSYLVANDAFGSKWAATLRVWQASGYAFGDKMLTLGGSSLGNRPGNGISQYIYNFLRNNHAIPVGQLNEEDLCKIEHQLIETRPTVLYGYPSIIYLIARYLIQRKTVAPSIKRVITTSELLFPGQRRVIEEAFQAPVFDEYGCPEVGLIAGECGYHQGLHYAMELCLVEVLDNANNLIPLGHAGRLVATNLLNRAMCLIRYDTGDVGAISNERCKCGRGLLRIKGLEGRTRDLIYAPGRRIIHGVEINHLIYKHAWVDRYQIIQETSHELTLMLGISSEIDAAQIEQLQTQLSEHTGMVVTLKVNVPFIETNGKKNRLIISKIEAPDERE